MQRAPLPLTLLALALGCGPGTPASPGSESSNDESSSSTAAPTSTSSAADTSGSSTTVDELSASSTSAASTSGTTTSTFIQPLDFDIAESCDGYQQDCPAGQKCMPYADDGGSSWTNTRCVRVMEDPARVGEPCFVVDSILSGLDNCELGAMCWDVDAENMGVCATICTGSVETPICPQGYWCSRFDRGGANAGVCIAQCAPLAQDCDPGDVCIASPDGRGFLCTLDASGREGQAHDPCEFASACDPGLFCADPNSAKECDMNQVGCCEPFCDLTAPNTCPGEDQVCIPYFDPAPNPAGSENVGRCTLP